MAPSRLLPTGQAWMARGRAWWTGMPVLGHANVLIPAPTAVTGPRRAFGADERPGSGAR